jgi:hypothetical protein
MNRHAARTRPEPGAGDSRGIRNHRCRVAGHHEAPESHLKFAVDRGEASFDFLNVRGHSECPGWRIRIFPLDARSHELSTKNRSLASPGGRDRQLAAVYVTARLVAHNQYDSRGSRQSAYAPSLIGALKQSPIDFFR